MTFVTLKQSMKPSEFIRLFISNEYLFHLNLCALAIQEEVLTKQPPSKERAPTQGSCVRQTSSLFSACVWK